MTSSGPLADHLLQSRIVPPLVVMAIAIFIGVEATELFLHWWWGTGFLTTEAFENGLVVHGMYFKPWSKLQSYERATEFTVIALTPLGTRQIRIRVAGKDRDEWERIFSEHGVPPAHRLVKNRTGGPDPP